MCLVAVVLVLIAIPVSAQATRALADISAPVQSFTTSITAEAGVLLGTAREFVYDNGYKLSELDWSLSPVLYYGSRLALNMAGGFEASLDIKSGFSGLSGSITDSDYLNYDGVKTHFSKHDCYTERALSIEARAGWPAITTPRVTVAVLGFLDVLDYKWSARDGYLQYPSETSAPYTPWSESTTKTSIVGTGIIYEQSYFSLGLMLDAHIMFSRVLSGRLGIGYSPITICNDVDNHLFTGVDYYETMSGGYHLHTEASMNLQIRPDMHLVLGGSYRLIQGLMGNTKMVYTTEQQSETQGTTYYSPSNSAGASLAVFDINMKLIFDL